MLIKEKDNRLFLKLGPIYIVLEAFGKDKPLVFQIGMKEVIPGFEQGILGEEEFTNALLKLKEKTDKDKLG